MNELENNASQESRKPTLSEIIEDLKKLLN